MTTVYLPVALMLFMLWGNCPGVKALKLAGLSLTAASTRSTLKTRSLASTGLPSDHLKPGFMWIVTVLSPLLNVGLLARLSA